MSERLSTELKWSVDDNTVADVPTPIQSWDVPDGAVVRLQSGRVAIGDFTTTDANSGPAGANADPSRRHRLALGYREPGAPLDDWTIFTLELPIGPFNDLSLKDQQSGENAQQRRFEFDPEAQGVNGPVIGFEDADEIALLALGPDEIDGSASQFSYPMEFDNE